MLQSIFNIKDSNFTDITTEDDVTGESRDIATCRTIACQLNWTAGTMLQASLNLQCSNDNVNFITVGSASMTGASGTVGINFDQPGFFYTRIQLTVNEGSLTITSAYISAKN